MLHLFTYLFEDLRVGAHPPVLRACSWLFPQGSLLTLTICGAGEQSSIGHMQGKHLTCSTISLALHCIHFKHTTCRVLTDRYINIWNYCHKQDIDYSHQSERLLILLPVPGYHYHSRLIYRICCLLGFVSDITPGSVWELLQVEARWKTPNLGVCSQIGWKWG